MSIRLLNVGRAELNFKTKRILSVVREYTLSLAGSMIRVPTTRRRMTEKMS